LRTRNAVVLNETARLEKIVIHGKKRKNGERKKRGKKKTKKKIVEKT